MGRKKVPHAAMLGFVGSLLKACMLSRGGDIYVTREQVAQAENDFDLRINPDDDGFRLSLRRTPEDEAPKLEMPSDIWTPGS